jgi:putative transcriptional regulator
MENRLKELRKAKKLTQEQLAKIVGISQSYISDIEKGVRDMDFTLAERFAKALNIKPYELMPLEWQPQPVTPAEQQILDMIRKTTAADNSQTENSKAE